MAKPQDTYPETATNGARETANGNGATVQEALTAHSDDLAGIIESTDEIDEILTTAILIAASADRSELDHITSSTTNLIEAIDGLSTEETATLATDIGENAGELSVSLDTILELQRQGHLDDLVIVATAFAESLSAEEVEELSMLLEESGPEIVTALDTVLDLQREGHLEDVIDLAKTLSVLEIDEDAAQGLNAALAAVGEAQQDSKPIGILGTIKQLGSRDFRAGFGYLVTLLKALGRRSRNQ